MWLIMQMYSTSKKKTWIVMIDRIGTIYVKNEIKLS